MAALIIGNTKVFDIYTGGSDCFKLNNYKFALLAEIAGKISKWCLRLKSMRSMVDRKSVIKTKPKFVWTSKRVLNRLLHIKQWISFGSHGTYPQFWSIAFCHFEGNVIMPFSWRPLSLLSKNCKKRFSQACLRPNFSPTKSLTVERNHLKRVPSYNLDAKNPPTRLSNLLASH